MQDHVTPSAYALSTRMPSSSGDGAFITYYDIKRFVNRYAKTIVAAGLLGVLGAGAYVFTAVPLYTARTQIIIDPSLPQAVQQSHAESMFSLDNAQVESQLEMLRSEKIAAAVVKELKLQDEPEFSIGAPSLISRALRLFRPTAEMTDFQKERVALIRLQAGLTVRRVGLSYAIDILFTSRSPALAAKIANATADAYVAEQIAARAQAARQGGVWLEERIDQLRKQMNKAALDAQEFRAKRDYRLAPGSATTSVGARSSQRETAQEDSEAKRHNTMEELDSTAQTFRRIYESYLMAYTESVQKQSYPITNARVITAATPPMGKSHPKSKLILAFGGLMGGLAGLGIAFFRYSIDRSVSDPRQIREDAGVECLASIPLLARRATPSPLARAMFGKAAMGRMVRTVVADPSSSVSAGVNTLKGAVSRATNKLDNRLFEVLTPSAAPVAAPNEALDAVITAPFSGFSHGIKTLKTAISLAGRMRQARCIAITSALPNEGKTTIAANLATLFALSGVRTLLVDGDLRNASLTRTLAPDAEHGLIDAMAGVVDVERCIIRANESGLDLLPASDAAQLAQADDVLASEHAHALLKELQKTYDMIIFEMPPLTVSLEALTVGSMVDGTLIVAEWSKTPLPVLSEAIYLLRNARASILGVALNKVDASAMHYGDVAANYMKYTSPSPAIVSRRA
jgi:capsular exopolysaccharide synthesis family protein